MLTRDAANTWLTDATVADIGQAVAVSINHYRREHQQQPTWAQALAGVDAKLLIPLTVVPPGWPLPPAAWRRDLRTRLMNHLKHTGWITYSTKPRSLQVGSRGHAWLTVTGQPHPASPHTDAGTRGRQAETVSPPNPGLHRSALTASPSIDCTPRSHQ